MASDAETGDRRNDVLSQSYTQGVGRVAQQNNDVGFSFELPKEVLEKREKVWDNLFDKYADEVSDEIELNINTMEPAATEEEEDDEEDEDDEESREYYSKCRGPMRKLPALIQYWIDTGNPPYQLVGDDDHSETGSSLSEGEHSRTGHSDILRESSDKNRPDDVSPYSSVDTAAYILSNTNVTKKAETMAIVEGAKKPEDPHIAMFSPQKDNILAQRTTKIGNKNISFSSMERDLKSISNFTQNSPVSASAKKIISQSEVQALTKPLKNAKLDDLSSSPTESQNHLSPSQQSVKLSEVLPTFRQFDELLQQTHMMRPPRVRSSLSKVRRKPKLVVASPNDEGPTASRSSQISSVLPNGLNKPQNRRKLYTGRNSPVDLVNERTSIDSVQPTGNCLHPALEPDTTEKHKVSTFASRARARKKRKRASQAAQLVSQEDNTSQVSVAPISTENFKGDMRYTDFFESLGLTPSKTIIGETPVTKPVPKRSRKSEKRVKTRKPMEKVKLCDTIDSSIKETVDTSQLTEDSVFSPIARKSSNSDAANKLLGNKILAVHVVRLSDECLARYQRRDAAGERLGNLETAAVENDHEIATTTSSSSSANKKSKSSLSENIELLTTVTHDSDSSTILICACNNDNNERYSDSDNSLFTKNISKTKKKLSFVEKGAAARTLRSGQRKSAVKMNAEITRNFAELTEVAQKPEIMKKIEYSLDKTQDKAIIEKLSKLPKALVRLEKLEINNLPKLSKTTNSLRKSKESERTTVQNNDQFTSEFSCGTKIPAPTGIPVGLFGSSPSVPPAEARNKCVTIGSRVVKDSNETPVKPQKHRAAPTHRSLGISIPSDEEEDSFVKLVKEFGSERRTMKIETEETKKISGNDVTNGVESVTTVKSQMPTRFRSNFGISISSDEEGDGSIKPVQKGLSKRRMARLVSKTDTGNEVSYRTKKIVSHNLTEELTNVDEGVRLNNRHDDSNRRKVTNVEKTHENVEAGVNGKIYGVRRSARKKKIPSCAGSDENLTNSLSLSTKPKHMRNLFADANFGDEDKVYSPWDNRDPELTDEKSGPVNAVSQSDKSNDTLTKVTRSGRNDKSSTVSSLNLARFQTRLDSDSDTDVELLRFSLNTKCNQPNCTDVFERNEPIVEDSRVLRTSPRRSFKKLIDRRIELSERKLKRGKNSVEESPDASERDSIPVKTEATQVTTSSNNRLPLRNEFSTSDTSNKTKDSNRKEKNTKLKIDSQEKRTPQKTSSKTVRWKNPSKPSPRQQASSPLANRLNSEFSPIAKKKPRRTRLLGTPMESESDDDVKLTEAKVDSSEAFQRQKCIFSNGISPKQCSDKSVTDDRNSSNERRDGSKNLFSNCLEDSVEDIDFMFGADAKSAAKKCTVVIDSLNFVSANKHKNLDNMRQSTISFRTKLRSDSDDDVL